MSWNTEEERQRVSADLIKLFSAFMGKDESGGRWPGILRWTINTLLHAKNCSFLDIYDFLADSDATGKRKDVLRRVEDQRIHKYWETFPKAYPKDATTPILSRMAQFVLVPPVSTMLGEVTPVFNLVQAIKDRKIILIDLTGAGDDTTNLLGVLMVSRIQQAMSRGLPAPLHLFCDEFQNFQTSAFDKILSESGGLGLRLTLANQYVDQLDVSVRNAVFHNVSTYMSLRIGDDDTRYFRSMMPPGGTDANGKPRATPHEALAQLPKYTALFAIAGKPSIIKSIPPPAPPPTQEQLKAAEDIKNSTISIYGVDSCKSAPVSHTSLDGTKPEPEPTLPHDESQTRGADAPRGVFRSQDKRSGGAPKKPNNK
jgi:tRNA isopentenyl-2-thiomethyl-A-37 hydroxylase MiaE